MTDRFNSDDPACPFHAIIDPHTYSSGELRIGAPMSFMSDNGVTTVLIKTIEVQPGTGLVGVTW